MIFEIKAKKKDKGITADFKRRTSELERENHSYTQNRI